MFDLLPIPQPADFVSTITCDGPIGPSDPVAIVRLQAADPGTGDVVLRDYGDSANPRTVCTFGRNRPVQLIDARHVVIEELVLSAYAVVDLPEVRFHWFEVPREPGLSGKFVAVSPGLDQVVWLATRQLTETTGMDDVHITTSAGDLIVASLPRPIGGRCGGPDDSKLGAYTRSGDHLYVLDQPISAANSLLVVEGATVMLSVVPPEEGWGHDGHPGMAVWSPSSETLYYRIGSDVWQWAAGSSPEIFLPGVHWLHPTITPDGSHLAYSVPRPLPDARHDVYLVDLDQGGSPRLIAEARDHPVFLNSTQLWFRAEGDGGCITNPFEPLIYDLNDSTESPSVIDQVFGVWPATSSNH